MTDSYTRAPKAHRELLKEIVWNTAYSTLPQPSVFNVSIGQKSCLVSLRFEARLGWGRAVNFFKIHPHTKNWDDPDHWAAYWVNGNGMKVYGNFEIFEKDMLYLKLQQ